MALVAVMGLSGCGGKDVPQDNRMHVFTEIHDMHRCTRISPEIKVTNPPADTGYYSVRLDRVGEISRYQGGGTWRFNGVVEEGINTIPEGALTQNYRGPCESGRYRLTVSALKRGESEPLDVSSYTFDVQ